ncbi:MAG: FAD-dependent oxidoreductase, partial [Gammaproteobacteria bacterium]|nr:FAD-dependent oxidoreductase [Gammaproteobacteria bacterium]
GVRVRLNDAVRKVTWDEEGVRIDSTSGTTRWERAVVTLPLGILQRARGCGV